MVKQFREWPPAERPDRMIRMVSRRSLTPGELKLRRLIAECFEVDEDLIATKVEEAMGGFRPATPFDACLIGPNGPDADRHG